MGRGSLTPPAETTTGALTLIITWVDEMGGSLSKGWKHGSLGSPLADWAAGQQAQDSAARSGDASR